MENEITIKTALGTIIAEDIEDTKDESGTNAAQERYNVWFAREKWIPYKPEVKLKLINDGYIDCIPEAERSVTE